MAFDDYPDWVEERFGNDVPEWVEERWSSGFDYDEDAYGDGYDTYSEYDYDRYDEN